ncbi:hypothetical protein GCM10027187_40210 [Streptosporangium sandarakinum]|uniref:Integrase n=1 Tax=Streptosporangium sandarakinum TaxID=1260955 RepID=A0A852VAS4_9ACTN|nr:tyrosine-type recombinase/integrase [Streptosporangium sandarakinum]NYF44648.1 integrase [Streptosporangium sandarakinum]
MTHLPEVTAAASSTDMLPAAAAADPLKNPYHAYLAKLDSADSKRTMRGCLDRVARILAGHDPTGLTPAGDPDPAVLAITGEHVRWHLLRYEHAVQLRDIIARQGSRRPDGTVQPWSPSHRNKHLVAIRQVLDQAWLLGQMSAEDRDRAQQITNFKGTRLRAGEHIPIERVGALLAACDADATEGTDTGNEALRRMALRDAAIIATLYTSGVRRAELAGIALADYDPIEGALRVRGKGDKERLVYVTRDAVARIEAWLTVRGRAPGGLFAPFTPRGGHVRTNPRGQVDHITGQTVGDVLNVRGEQARIGPQRAHNFRRTWAGNLLNLVDLATVQALAGHASPATTAGYDRRPEEARRQAVNRLPSPEAKPLPGVAPLQDRAAAGRRARRRGGDD